MGKRVAIAVPAHDEAEAIGECVRRLAAMHLDGRVGELSVVVLANNCADGTVEAARRAGHGLAGRLEIQTVDLPPERANAGWARRLALEAAAARLRAEDDVLMCTDADTLVADDWVDRALDHIEAGYDAVAGLARLNSRELRRLPPVHRARLALIQRYENALTFLKAGRAPEEPWPRHYYEGGANIALTLRAHDRIGGAPTPPVGEDKALFDAVRRHGGKVRHPTDVRVLTSARLVGRAPGGASETLARWGEQGEDEPIWGIRTISASLGLTSAESVDLSFAELPAETVKARALVEAARRRGRLSRVG